MRPEVRLRIFAADPDRARAFYAQVFGWRLPEDADRYCWAITTSDDPRLGVDGPGPAGVDHSASPDERFIPTIHVSDLDATTAAVRAAGGDVLVPRIPIPGVGWLVYLADSEGNLIGIMQDDPHAAWPKAPSPDPPADRPGSGNAARAERHHGQDRRSRDQR